MILKNINSISFTLLIIFQLLYLLSILFVDGYPQTNDILHIFKISPLEGNQKFINGIYGPGYTYYSLIFTNSLTILSSVIYFLSLVSSFLLLYNLKYFSEGKNSQDKLTIYSISILFHIILILTIGFNHSDSIFILLFYNGLLIFILSYYFKNNIFFTLFGISIIGLSIIFRHHGPFAIFFLFLNFLLFEYFRNKKNLLLYPKYLLFGFVIILPTFLSYIHLNLIDATVNWQTSFKLHFFFHGDLWGDWRDLKQVLNTEEVKNFNVFNVEISHAIKIILNHVKGILRIIYPFIFCFLIALYLSRKKVVLLSFILFLSYNLIVLAGYHRGYYPGIFFCLISLLICYKDLSKNKIAYFLIYVFLIGHLIYVGEKYITDTKNRYVLNQEIKKDVVPLLEKKQISYENIFSDDYNFYTTKLKGEIHKLCNWGGWLLNHPYLDNYYPKKVLKGDDKNFCDVKALITRDKEFASIYISNNEFDEYYNFKIYHLFIRK